MTTRARPEPGIASRESDCERSLPNLVPDGAFVLQLAAAAGVPPAIGGRVEHIPTGEWCYFDGLDELLGFLAAKVGSASR